MPQYPLHFWHVLVPLLEGLFVRVLVLFSWQLLAQLLMCLCLQAATTIRLWPKLFDTLVTQYCTYLALLSAALHSNNCLPVL